MFLSIEAFFTGCLLAVIRWRSLLRWILAAAVLVLLTLGPLVLLVGSDALSPPEDLTTWARARLRGEGPLDLWTVGLLALAAATFVQASLLQGGLVESLARGGSTDSRRFFGSCGELAGRSLRAAVPVAALLVGWGKLTGELWITLAIDPPYDGALRAAHDPVVVALLTLGVIVPILLYDTATITLASERRASALLAFGRALSLWGRRPFAAGLLALLEGTATVAIGAGGWWLWRQIPIGWNTPAKAGAALVGFLLVTGWWRLQLVAAAGVLVRRITASAAERRSEPDEFQGYSELPPSDIREI